MRERLKEIAESIARMEEERKEKAEWLRRDHPELLPGAAEKGLYLPVKKVELNLSVGGVDGGLIAQAFQGFDFVMTRALGVLFEYEGSVLKSYRYHPSPIPPFEMEIKQNLDSHEFLWFRSLFRIRREIATALSFVEEMGPELLLLDGSIVPQISDRPSETSQVRELYREVIGHYKELYERCDGKSILAGVIKDSRGKRYLEMIRDSGTAKGSVVDVLTMSNDTSFLNFLLREGERTPSFTYAKSEKENPVLRDLGRWGRRIRAMYLKPSSNDRPLRVEFLEGEDPERVAELISALSAINRNYAYPAVLIEADLRAAVPRVELERAYRELLSGTGLKASMRKMRRDSRPFR